MRQLLISKGSEEETELMTDPAPDQQVYEIIKSMFKCSTNMKTAWEREKKSASRKLWLGVKQPYGYAGARMRWRVWHVLGTQRSSAAETAAAQQGRPEADQSVSAAAGQHSKCQSTCDLSRQDTNCPSIWQSELLLLSICDSPSQWWCDLSYASRWQGVEVGHVWSGVMPWHSYTNNRSTR